MWPLVSSKRKCLLHAKRSTVSLVFLCAGDECCCLCAITSLAGFFCVEFRTGGDSTGLHSDCIV